METDNKLSIVNRIIEEFKEEETDYYQMEPFLNNIEMNSIASGCESVHVKKEIDFEDPGSSCRSDKCFENTAMPVVKEEIDMNTTHGQSLQGVNVKNENEMPISCIKIEAPDDFYFDETSNNYEVKLGEVEDENIKEVRDNSESNDLLETTKNQNQPNGKIVKDRANLKMPSVGHKNSAEESKTTTNRRSAKSKNKALEIVPSEPFQCTYCSKTFKQNFQLREHVKNVHSLIKYDCFLCEKRIKCKKYLWEHLKSVHMSDGELVRLKCNLCGEGFRHDYYLQFHKYHNHSAGKHMCIACKKKFKTKASLRDHKRTAHYMFGEMYECWCGEQFRSPYSLQTHEEDCH